MVNGGPSDARSKRSKGHAARDGNNKHERAPGLATSNVYNYLSLSLSLDGAYVVYIYTVN